MQVYEQISSMIIWHYLSIFLDSLNIIIVSHQFVDSAGFSIVDTVKD